jgi:peptide-methionine (R)-S-oxide reductase
MIRRNNGPLDRRAFLLTGSSAVVSAALAFRPDSAEGAPAEVTIIDFSDAGTRGAAAKVAKVVKTDAQWRQQLSNAAYQVTRHEDTEVPYTGPYWDNHDAGLYRCICCDTALFTSDTKFDSHTGWPSFWDVLAKENILAQRDASLGMVRTAIACRRCDAHLGHVFDDGPKPTGLRYCMNSVAMRFVKRA